ncbi:hypothetical protein WR25_06884 isoform G [Diploscapter pachys]|nr:hypothetical protein WR25_06884 isoform B [Diploscapter pachys]PAV80871.1 hypothetical protein WR25_06884 isoform C [Diploscapter pachys]PAV80872.1 hypothetical protein WR25_06884 isoform D [Diploscapter pachys]PAV80873.1 hypothetical protein WR25_06884 isoform E [Diploscapter pachys]PAV80874.1 hypothetical protein WR25_06884 isoform F [Diploscapter pachys]
MMMNEKLPEWADGTTTMDDMIELKGFEEPVKKTRRGQRKKENGRGDSTSRPTSRGNADDETANKKKEETPDSVDENSKSSGVTGIAGASETGPDKSAAIGEELQRASAMGAGLPKATLPENDLELAALLGLLDGDTIKQSAIPDPILPSVEESAPSGSRLSRFFRNSANAAPGANAPTHEVAGSRISPPKSALPPSMSGSVSAAADLVRSTQSPSEDSPVLPVLAKIFGQQHNTTPAEVQPQATQPNLPTRGLRGVMRLEDIERGLVSGQSSSQSIDELKGGKQSRQSSLAAKGNPLQDPSQQAHLINQLYKISRMQEGSGEQQEHHHGAAGQQTQPGLHGLFGVPSSSQEPPSAVSAASATSAPHHPVVQALLANAHSNQQSPNPIFANILQNNPAMAAHIHASAQQMLAQFSLANPGQPIPQGIQDQINLLALRHHIALQQQHQHQQQQQQENLDMHHQHAHPLAAAAAHLQQQQQQQQQADPVTSSATSQGPGGLPPHLAALLSGLHQNAAQAAAPSNPLLHANILQRLAENPSLSEHIQASAQQMLAQMALSGQQQPFQDQINLAAMRNLLSAQQQQQQQQQQQEGSFDQSQANAAGSSSAVPPTPPAHSIPSLLAAAASAGQHPNAAALQALHHGTVLQRLAENPALINAHIQASVHQMMAQAALQNPGQPVPQQIQDQINMLAIRNRALMQQQVAAYVSMQQAAAAAQQQQQNAAKSAAAAGNRPTMIPASVQRVMRANGGATTTGAAGSASGTGQGSAE